MVNSDNQKMSSERAVDAGTPTDEAKDITNPRDVDVLYCEKYCPIHYQVPAKIVLISLFEYMTSFVTANHAMHASHAKRGAQAKRSAASIYYILCTNYKHTFCVL
jgi:hypothetical protein